MTIEIIAVERDEKEIFRNLLEKFNYELSQYIDNDVNKLGLYGYDYLDSFWKAGAKRWAYFIKVDGKLAGFATLIGDYFFIKDRKSDYMMTDFFVMYKYRGAGVGKFVANYLFEKYKGIWQLNAINKNTNSIGFWKKVVGDYTNDAYEVIPNEEKGAEHNSVFCFSTEE